VVLDAQLANARMAQIRQRTTSGFGQFSREVSRETINGVRVFLQFAVRLYAWLAGLAEGDHIGLRIRRLQVRPLLGALGP